MAAIDSDSHSVVYINGEFLPAHKASVSVFDRGFLMADGVYEVTSVIDGKMIDWTGHMNRLTRSLHELEMVRPPAGCGQTDDELLDIQRELIRRNNVNEGLVYIQITRGSSGERDFTWPDTAETHSTIVIFTQSKPGILTSNPLVERGLRVITLDDLRWGRRDVKTVQLLYQSMAKMRAKQAGVDDAWLVGKPGMDGSAYVTEGTSSNAFIVKGRAIITPALSNDILRGITRAAVLCYASEAGMDVQERSFTVREAQEADEAFHTSSSSAVLPVVEINGIFIGDGTPGPTSQRLRTIYLEKSRQSAV